MTTKKGESSDKIECAVCFMSMFFSGGAVALIGSMVFGILFLSPYWTEIISWLKNVFAIIL